MKKKKKEEIFLLYRSTYICTSCSLLFSHFLRQLFERKRSFTQQFITPNHLLTLSDKKWVLYKKIIDSFFFFWIMQIILNLHFSNFFLKKDFYRIFLMEFFTKYFILIWSYLRNYLQKVYQFQVTKIHFLSKYKK